MGVRSAKIVEKGLLKKINLLGLYFPYIQAQLMRGRKLSLNCMKFMLKLN